MPGLKVVTVCILLLSLQLFNKISSVGTSWSADLHSVGRSQVTSISVYYVEHVLSSLVGSHGFLVFISCFSYSFILATWPFVFVTFPLKWKFFLKQKPYVFKKIRELLFFLDTVCTVKCEDK